MTPQRAHGYVWSLRVYTDRRRKCTCACMTRVCSGSVYTCVHVRSICEWGECVCIQQTCVWDTRVPACVHVVQGVCVDARMCTCAHRGCTAVSVPVWSVWAAVVWRALHRGLFRPLRGNRIPGFWPGCLAGFISVPVPTEGLSNGNI